MYMYTMYIHVAYLDTHVFMQHLLSYNYVMHNIMYVAVAIL